MSLHFAGTRRPPQPLGQAQPEPVEQRGLVAVGAHPAADSDLALWVARERQHDVGALGPTELVQDGARATYPAATEKLMARAAGIKARGDVAGAKKLLQAYVDAGAEVTALRDVVTERWLRAPKASFVHAIVL